MKILKLLFEIIHDRSIIWDFVYMSHGIKLLKKIGVISNERASKLLKLNKAAYHKHFNSYIDAPINSIEKSFYDDL